jgi:excisionase family DNA binding protein
MKEIPMPATKVSKHILVVEDDPSVAMVLKARLQSMGHQVAVERTGREGLAAASARVPGLIILDLKLPDMSGFDVCAELRRIHGPWIPILILTALDQPHEKIKGYACGADAYLTKPYNPQEFLKTVSLLTGAGGSMDDYPVESPDPAERAFFGVDEAARRFGVNTTTIYRLARKGRLPGFKIGSQWRFSAETIRRWTAGNRGDAASESAS